MVTELRQNSFNNRQITITVEFTLTVQSSYVQL